MAFSNGKKAFSLPADVRCALTYMSVTSEEEQIPSGVACGPADTDPHVTIQRKEWTTVIATDFCRGQKHSSAKPDFLSQEVHHLLRFESGMSHRLLKSICTLDDYPLLLILLS